MCTGELMSRRLAIAFIGLATASGATMAEPAPEFARYMPLYPALYSTLGWQADDRNRIYRQDGSESDDAAPNSGGSGATAFPETRSTVDFTWYFPMWEADDLPFFSNRLHTARVRLSHARTKTTGRLAEFAADPSDDSYTQADNLENNGSGIGDLVLEFGSVVFGSPDWRNGKRTSLAVTAVVGLTLPFGENNRDAPANAADNHGGFHLQLGGHWQPWTGALLDAGITRRAYFQNYDAAFGQLTPTEQGDDTTWDLSLAQRVLPGLYLGAFADRRRGDANGYENPTFAANAPPPRGDSTDNIPKPGFYHDGGTALSRVGLSAHYFILQNWLAGLYYTRPLSGKSGEFDLPYENHSPAYCIEGATGCTITPMGDVQVDGLGSARSFANDTLRLTLTYQFGQGDAFTCRGCESH